MANIILCELVSSIFRGDVPDRDDVLSHLGKHEKPYMCGGRVCWRDAGVFDFSDDVSDPLLRRGEKVGRVGLYCGVPAVVGEDVYVWEESVQPVMLSARDCCAPKYEMYALRECCFCVLKHVVYTRTRRYVVSDLKKFVRSKKLLRNPTEERALKYLNN